MAGISKTKAITKVSALMDETLVQQGNHHHTVSGTIRTKPRITILSKIVGKTRCEETYKQE